MGKRRVEVEIIGDARSLDRAFGQAERKASGFGRVMKGIAAGAVFTGFAALGTAVKVGTDELLEAERVAKDTKAVLKSTGWSAGARLPAKERPRQGQVLTLAPSKRTHGSENHRPGTGAPRAFAANLDGPGTAAQAYLQRRQARSA